MFSWSFFPSRCLKSGELNGKIYHLHIYSRVIKFIVVIGGRRLACDQRFVALNAAQMRPTWMGHLCVYEGTGVFAGKGLNQSA